MSVPRRVLIVEEQAHLRRGHFPVLFAETAAALVDLGCEVTVLTTQGWALEDPLHPPVFAVSSMDGIGGATYRFAMRMARRFPSRAVSVAKRIVCDITVTLQAGRLARHLDADVVMMTWRPRPYLVLLCANARRWIVLQFFPHASGSAAWTDRIGAGKVLALAEQVRRRRGGGVVLAANSDGLVGPWQSALPGIDVRRLYFTGARATLPSPAVRQRLQIAAGDRIALYFGGDGGHKRLEPVLELFAEWEASGDAPDWKLIVAGESALAAQVWVAKRGLAPTRIRLYPGYVDDRLRDDLHDACDVVVLSFRPGWNSDSGSLGDAVAWGKPVVCSDQSTPADLVRWLGFGEIFESGSAEALGRALRALPLELPEATKERARIEYSIRSAAERYLVAFDSIGPRPRSE